MQKDKSKWMRLGVCRKPHGIKGAFDFHLDNAIDSALDEGVEIHITPLESKSSVPEEGMDIKISQISFGNKVIVYLENVNDRNVVEEMIPFEIYIDRASLPELEEGEYYLQDLIGLTVVDQETGNEVGKVRDLLDNSAQTILEIRGKMNFEIPLVDAFVKEINFEEQKIIVLLPDYDDE